MKNQILFILAISTMLNYSCQSEKKKECCVKDEQTTKTKDAANSNKESIYQVEGEWKTQDNKFLKLVDLKGNIQVVAMVFTNCAYACPRIVADMQLIESKIPTSKKNKVKFLLISFDVARDTPDRLKVFAKESGLNDNWTLLHGTEEEVQEIAVVLGVKYEKQPDGSFAHSNMIIVLDEDGAIAYQQEGLGTAPDKTIEKINNLFK